MQTQKETTSYESHDTQALDEHLAPAAVCRSEDQVDRPDFSEAIVELRDRKVNMNYVGVHFGGAIFSMTDPFHMVLTMNRLGRGYVVWDKSAELTI